MHEVLKCLYEEEITKNGGQSQVEVAGMVAEQLLH